MIELFRRLRRELVQYCKYGSFVVIRCEAPLNGFGIRHHCLLGRPKIVDHGLSKREAEGIAACYNDMRGSR